MSVLERLKSIVTSPEPVEEPPVFAANVGPRRVLVDIETGQPVVADEPDQRGAVKARVHICGPWWCDGVSCRK
jgi:hypothetical protein